LLLTLTGSGKSLSYIIPIVNHVLREGSGRGIKAIVVYPMNALANSQKEELTKFLTRGYENSKSPVIFACYTGQEKLEEKERILSNPPDILLTNFVMLELILTRPDEERLIRAAQGLRFLVLDERRHGLCDAGGRRYETSDRLWPAISSRVKATRPLTHDLLPRMRSGVLPRTPHEIGRQQQPGLSVARVARPA
jgi:hypothetical protein